MFEMHRLSVSTLVIFMLSVPALAQDETKDLAKKLANPLASMISVPTQVDYDENIGPDEDGSLMQINIQPVIPFSLSNDWLLISRTIVPLIDQEDIPIKGEGESGIGDILQSLFFSPNETTEGGWIWGAGPVMLLPTASDDALGAEQWAVGPTAVALKQEGPWTFGALANHLWSIDGEDGRDDINATYFEPWVSYITKTNTTISLSTENTYDWQANEWSIPITFTVDQLFEFDKQPVAIGGAIRYWAESPEYGPHDWGFRLQMTFLFPK